MTKPINAADLSKAKRQELRTRILLGEVLEENPAGPPAKWRSNLTADADLGPMRVRVLDIVFSVETNHRKDGAFLGWEVGGVRGKTVNACLGKILDLDVE